ncbi:MAG: hypothetical protein KI786_05020, partial [Mameliella sp.]|nr:hypothetical protein [Phaeodactylibacter sp.]
MDYIRFLFSEGAGYPNLVRFEKMKIFCPKFQIEIYFLFAFFYLTLQYQCYPQQVLHKNRAFPGVTFTYKKVEIPHL